MSIPQLVSVSLFAEGSYNTAALFSLVKRASLFIVALVAPVMLILWFLGGFILGIIGKNYINVPLLRLFLISIVPYTINTIFFAYLRVSVRLNLLVAISAFLSISVLGLAFTLGPLIGSPGLALGWLGGQTITSLAVLASLAYRYFKKR